MAFTPGYNATFSFGGTAIGAYLENVSLEAEADNMELPRLAGSQVAQLPGPTKTTIEVEGWLDSTAIALFTAKIYAATKTVAAFVYVPQGSGVGEQYSGNVYVTNVNIETDAGDPAKFTASLVVDEDGVTVA